MAVRKVKLRGRVKWRARVVVNKVERKAFRDTRAEALEAEAELRAELETQAKEPRTDGPQPTRKEKIPTVASFAEDFLKFCASPMASSRGANRPSTIEEKRKNLRCHIIPAFGHLRLDQLTTRRIDAFGIELAETRSRATVANVMGALKRMLTIAKRWGLIEKVPPIQTSKGKPDRLERDQFFSFEETERLLAATTKEHYPVLLVGIRTGLRTGELRGLRWSDVDLEDGWLHVRRQIDEKGRLSPPKNGKPRLVELAWDAIDILSKQPRTGQLVFPGPEGNPFAVNALERAVKAACRRAELVTEDGEPKRLGGHALRHTWASHAMMRGIPAKVVMAYGGWSSLAMLERYSHLAPQDVRGQMNRLAPQPSSPSRPAARLRRLDRGGYTGGYKTRSGRQKAS